MKHRLKLIKEWFLMKFTKHKIGSHGTIILLGKNKDICAECKKEVKR